MTSLISTLLFRLAAIIICAFFSLTFAMIINPLAGWILFGVGMIWFFLPPLTEKLPYSLPILNNLKTISGAATNIVHSIDISGTDNGITTTQMISFDIDGFQAAALKLPGPIYVYDGNHVVVSGLLKHGVLHGLAYKNLDRQITGKQPTFLYLVFAVLIAMGGLSILSSPDTKTFAYVLLLTSTWFFYQFGTVRDAYNNVKKWVD